MKPYDDIKPLNKIEELFDFSGKVAVIVGGAGKMGQSFARALSLAGASVVLADINEQACKKAAKDIAGETSAKVIGISCNASKEQDVVGLFEQVNKDFGGVDCLICNTMTKPKGYYAPFKDYPLDTFNQVLQGNLSASFLASREAVKYMKQGASIVLTASTYAICGPDQRIYKGCSAAGNIYGDEYALNAPASYCASKSGLLGLCRYLATLLGDKGIRVNVLTPGGVYDGQEEAFHKEYVNRVPLGRMATWTDYNGAILFLCSAASRYMTGNNLIVDGGWSCW